jgi:hypothetical protein
MEIKTKTMTTNGRFMAFTDTDAGLFRKFPLPAQIDRKTADIQVYHKTRRWTKGTRLPLIGQSTSSQHTIAALPVAPHFVLVIV